MVKPLRFAVVDDSFLYVLFCLKVSTKRVASLSISSIHRNLNSVLRIANCTEHSHYRSIVTCLLVHCKRFFCEALRLQVLRPPFKESGFTTRHHKVLKAFGHIELSKHAWYLLLMCLRFNVVFDC